MNTSNSCNLILLIFCIIYLHEVSNQMSGSESQPRKVELTCTHPKVQLP